MLSFPIFSNRNGAVTSDCAVIADEGSITAAHLADLISVFVHTVVLNAGVLTAVFHIAEAGYIDLTGAVGASRGRLRFGGSHCGSFLIGGRASSSVLRSSSGTSVPSWSSGSVVVPEGASGFSGDSGFTGSAGWSAPGRWSPHPGRDRFRMRPAFPPGHPDQSGRYCRYPHWDTALGGIIGNHTGRNIGIAAEPDGDPNGRRNAEQAADGDEDDPLCLVCHGVCLLGVFLVNGTIPHFSVEVY